MRWNLIGAFVRNNPFGTEIAFRKGLERVGEEVNVYDPSVLYKRLPLDPKADVTVIFKWLDDGVLKDMLRAGFGGIKIVYQVDDLRFPHIKDMMVKMRDVCDHALTFDEDGAILARSYGFESARRLLLTADNELYRCIRTQKDIDVCFIGSLSNGPNHKSRMRMIEIVNSLGLRFVVANELFDIGKICEIYNRSKIVLNHATDVGQQFGHGYGYQCRHFEAGFSGAFVLSNVVDNDDELRSLKTFDSESDLVSAINYWLKNQRSREIAAEEFYDELCASHLPKHRAQEMIEFVKGIS